jgi:four helix bundle protein
MSGFRDLKVWQKAKDLAVQIYKVTQDGLFGRDFGFKDQIRRASVSIPSNIAEGDERGSNKEAVRFFYIAKGSLAELQTQLEIAHEIKYLDELIVNELLDKSDTIGKMLGSLIKARSSR